MNKSSAHWGFENLNHELATSVYIERGPEELDRKMAMEEGACFISQRVAGYDARWLGPFPTVGDSILHVDQLAFPHPPSATIVNMMKRILDVPFFYYSVDEMAVIWQYLNSIMIINYPAADYWYDFQHRDKHMLLNVEKMVAVLNYFQYLASWYHLNHPDWRLYTQEEWNQRYEFFPYLRIPELVEGTKAMIGNYITPIPKGHFPSQAVYEKMKHCASQIDINSATTGDWDVALDWIRSFNDPLARKIVSCQHFYEKMWKKLNTTTSNGNYACIFLTLQIQFILCRAQYGNAVDTYASFMRQQENQSWATLTPGKQLRNTMVKVTMVEGFNNPSYCLKQYKCPTYAQIQELKTFFEFHKSNTFEFPIGEMESIMRFFEYIQLKYSRSTYSGLVQGLTDSILNPMYTTQSNEFFSIYQYYVLDIAKKSKNFTLPYEEYKWNEKGQTKHQVDMAAIGHAVPFSDSQRTAYILEKWPHPSLLDEKHFIEYMQYAWPMPEIREMEYRDKPEEFGEKKRASIASYMQWFQLMVENRTLLTADKAIGCPVATKEMDGKFVTIYNFYPDFGVWKQEERSVWQKFVYFISGNFVFDILMDRAKQILNLIMHYIKGASNIITDFIQGNGSFFIAAAVAGIFILKEIK